MKFCICILLLLFSTGCVSMRPIDAADFVMPDAFNYSYGTFTGDFNATQQAYGFTWFLPQPSQLIRRHRETVKEQRVPPRDTSTQQRETEHERLKKLQLLVGDGFAAWDK